MSESSGQMEAVRRAAESRDREALYRAAHSLQGSVAVVGADSVARCCVDLVKVARRGPLDDAAPLVEELQSNIDAIRKALVGWGEGTRDAAADAPAPPYLPAGFGRRRILVIDDDEGIRAITQMLVEALGHEVESARDGIEGLAKLQ